MDDLIEENHDQDVDEDEDDEDIYDAKCGKKRGRKVEWPDHVVTDLVDIILSNDKWKTKLLLTNTKTVKNG